MSLQSNYNAHKYGGSAIVTPGPDSIQRQVKEQLYNRLVSEPEPGLRLVEPLPVHTDLSIEAIAMRYHKVTGFKASAVRLSRNGTGFVAVIDLVILGAINGTGQLVGQTGIIAGKLKVSDSFNLFQLENAEYLNA